MTTGRIHSYETLGGLDGPGLRTVVFLQGCPYRCGYCHNPDTWDFGKGTETTVESVMVRIRRYRPYYGHDGGVTLSGGEPLVQPIFSAEVLEACASEGIHTALDTAGRPFDVDVERALQAASLVILDIKDPDPIRFRELTGQSSRGMQEVFEWTRDHAKPIWIRQVIVPGWNDNEDNVRSLSTFLRGHPGLQRAELIGFHTMGMKKWEALGCRSYFAETAPMEAEKLSRLQSLLDAERAAAED